jgi:hypothetical protein
MKNVLIFASILIGLALFLGPTVLSGIFNKVKPSEEGMPIAAVSDEKSRQIVYKCADEKKFLAEFRRNTVQIQLPDGRVPTLKEFNTDDSGTWFKEDSSDLYMFVKDFSGFVTDDGKDIYARCVAST